MTAMVDLAIRATLILALAWHVAVWQEPMRFEPAEAKPAATVRIRDGKAEPAFKASGDITSMAAADGYIEIPAQTGVVKAGEIVDVRLF